MLIRVALLADLAGELLCNVILDVLEELLGAGQFGGLAHAAKTMSVQLYFKEIYVFLMCLPFIYHFLCNIRDSIEGTKPK